MCTFKTNIAVLLLIVYVLLIISNEYVYGLKSNAKNIKAGVSRNSSRTKVTTKPKPKPAPTERPVWQIFEDKNASIALLAAIPVMIILLLLVCLVYFCFVRKKSKKSEEEVVTPSKLMELNYSPEELRKRGITESSLRHAGASDQQIKKLLGGVGKHSSQSKKSSSKSEVKRTSSSHKNLVDDMQRKINASKFAKQQSMSPSKFSTAAKPVESDTFSEAMKAHGSQISTAPPK